MHRPGLGRQVPRLAPPGPPWALVLVRPVHGHPEVDQHQREFVTAPALHHDVVRGDVPVHHLVCVQRGHRGVQLPGHLAHPARRQPAGAGVEMGAQVRLAVRAEDLVGVAVGRPRLQQLLEVRARTLGEEPRHRRVRRVHAVVPLQHQGGRAGPVTGPPHPQDHRLTGAFGDLDDLHQDETAIQRRRYVIAHGTGLYRARVGETAVRGRDEISHHTAFREADFEDDRADSREKGPENTQGIPESKEVSGISGSRDGCTGGVLILKGRSPCAPALRCTPCLPSPRTPASSWN